MAAVGLTPLLAITRRVAVVAGIPAVAEEADTQAVAVVTVAVAAGTTNSQLKPANKKAALANTSAAFLLEPGFAMRSAFLLPTEMPKVASH